MAVEPPVRRPIPDVDHRLLNQNDAALQELFGHAEMFIQNHTVDYPEDPRDRAAMTQFIAACREDLNMLNLRVQLLGAFPLNGAQRVYLEDQIGRRIREVEQWIVANTPAPEMAPPAPLAGRAAPGPAAAAPDAARVPRPAPPPDMAGLGAPPPPRGEGPELGAAPPDDVAAEPREAPAPLPAAPRPNLHPERRAGGRAIERIGGDGAQAPQGCLDKMIAGMMRIVQIISDWLKRVFPCLSRGNATPPAAAHGRPGARPAPGEAQRGAPPPGGVRPAGPPAGAAVVDPPAAGAPAAGRVGDAGAAADLEAGVPAEAAGGADRAAGAADPAADLAIGPPGAAAAVAAAEPAAPIVVPDLPVGAQAVGHFVGTIDEISLGREVRIDPDALSPFCTLNVMRRLMQQVAQNRALTAETAPAFIDAALREAVPLRRAHKPEEVEIDAEMTVEDAIDGDQFPELLIDAMNAKDGALAAGQNVRAIYLGEIGALRGFAAAQNPRMIGAIFSKNTENDFVILDHRGIFYYADSIMEGGHTISSYIRSIITMLWRLIWQNGILFKQEPVKSLTNIELFRLG